MKDMQINKIYYSANQSLCMVRPNNILPERPYVQPLQVKGADEVEEKSKKRLAALLIGTAAVVAALIIAKRGKPPEEPSFRINGGYEGPKPPPYDISTIRLKKNGGGGPPPDAAPVRLRHSDGNPPDSPPPENILINHHPAEDPAMTEHEAQYIKMHKSKHSMSLFDKFKYKLRILFNKLKSKI